MHVGLIIPTDTDSEDEAELADLQVELKGVTAWFELGIQLKIPTSDLLVIRKDHSTVKSCRLEMLIRWGQLQRPTWTQIATALAKIGRTALAMELSDRYGKQNVQ